MNIVAEVYYEYSHYVWARLESSTFFNERGLLYHTRLPSFAVVEIIGYQSAHEYVFDVNNSTNGGLNEHDEVKNVISTLPQPIAEKIVKYMDPMHILTGALVENDTEILDGYGIELVYPHYGNCSDESPFNDAP